MTENTLRHLQKRLNDASDTKTKDWWERYLKHVIPFRGVKMAGIRRALHDWLEAEAITVRLTPAAQVGVALELLRQDHAEDKLAGILMLQEALIPAGAVDWQRNLPHSPHYSTTDTSTTGTPATGSVSRRSTRLYGLKASHAPAPYPNGATPATCGDAERQASRSSTSQSMATPTSTAS
ncbi:MAG: DNA alkylation repair protein [Chloroflexi bacterium]|nr:DNA alkylation repair protein [Chloroflexota bacterium]